MELGGNKNAQIYYEEKNMYKDGKPDHEAAPHAAYKQELSAKAESAVKAEAASGWGAPSGAAAGGAAAS